MDLNKIEALSEAADHIGKRHVEVMQELIKLAGECGAEAKKQHELSITYASECGRLRGQVDELKAELTKLKESKAIEARGSVVPDIEAMVSRFLGWKLPEDFAPDCGIKFEPYKCGSVTYWPVGTNLFHAGQARAMLEHVFAVAPAQPVQAALPDEFLESWRIAYNSFCAAFDNPIARRKIADDFSVDARRALRDFNDQIKLLSAAPTPPSAEPVIEKDARIGVTVFRKGVKVSTVLDCAYRHYENNPSKPIPANALCFVNTGNNETSGYVITTDLEPCRGCGNDKPEKRCLGCRHDFEPIAKTHEPCEMCSDGCAARGSCRFKDENLPVDEQPDSAAPEPEIFNNDAHTEIPSGHVSIEGFRWRQRGNSLWNYVFGRAPDSFELRDTEIENVIISSKPAKPQRITEQDAREIIESYSHWKLFDAHRDSSPEQWCKEDEGRILLAKLNEHRGPDYKAMAGELLHVIKRIVISWENKSDIFGAMLLARQTIAKHEGGK